MDASAEQTAILRGMWQEMKALNGRVDKTNDRLDGLRSDMDGLRGEVNGLRGEVNGLRGEVNGLRGEVDGLHSDMDGLRGDVNGLRNEMHAGFVLLGSRIDNLLLGEHGKEHALLRERVTRLEVKVGLDPPPRAE